VETPGGTATSGTSFTVLVPANPVPTVSELIPDTTAAGGSSFPLTVTGSAFVPGAVVRWNGADRSTTFVSTTQLEASIAASDITAVGTAQVTAANPGPGGGTSGARTFTIAAPPGASDGLSAGYNMDECAGSLLLDQSGHANDGMLINGPAWTTGKHRGALAFDGVNDRVSIVNSPKVDVSGQALTVEFWAYVAQGGSTPDYVIVNKPWTDGQMVSPYYQYGVEFYGATREFVFFIGTSSGYRAFPMGSAYGDWHHVAFTYDGASVRGYLDGVLKFTRAETSRLTARGAGLLLGVDGALAQPYKGMLDDLRIYARALS
jgi:hypothetical protein